MWHTLSINLISEETANNMVDNLFQTVDEYKKLLIDIWTFILSRSKYQSNLKNYEYRLPFEPDLKEENDSLLIYIQNYDCDIMMKLLSQLKIKIKTFMHIDNDWYIKLASASINKNGGYAKIVFQKI